MSEPIRLPATSPTERSLRGQSLTEFALLLPMLLVLFLGIADFGRVFTAGIIVESSARDGAEAAAQEYLQFRANNATMTAADWAQVHRAALDAVCDEAIQLPNHTVSGSSCTMPAAAVCIHEEDPALQDPDCGIEAGSAPPDCVRRDDTGTPIGGIHGLWDPGNPPVSGQTMLPYVEVRVCYKFTTLIDLSDLQLPFGWGLSLGDIWLQEGRSFTVADYD